MFFLIYFSLLIVQVHAQVVLTSEQVVAEALKNNYSIRIAKTENEISSSNVNLGNAGFLPQVELNVSQSLAKNNTKQNLTSGLQVDRNNVSSSNTNSGISLNWTIFDGMKMFVNYDRLKELEKLDQVKLKSEIESGIYNVLISYFEIVKLKQLIKVLKSSLEISEERIQIEETKFKSGASSKLDMLQAKLDANASRSAIFKQNIIVANLKLKLNQLMGKEAGFEFDVLDSIANRENYLVNQIKDEYMKSNLGVLLAERNMSIYALNHKMLQAERFPVIGFNTNYIFSRTENQAGFILLNQNLGLSGGITLRMNLFDGFKLNTKLKISNLNIQNGRTMLEQSKSAAETEIRSAIVNWETHLELVKMEKENLEIAKENIAASFEKYKVGSISSFQLKEAQKYYEAAYNQYVEAAFNLKISELQLLKSGGKIVQL